MFKTIKKNIFILILFVSGHVDSAETVNVEILLDLSGSMAGQIGKETKIELAKKTLESISLVIPDGDSVQVGLRIFGHLGDNTDENKVLSCSKSELIIAVSKFDKEQLSNVSEELKPTGWTPLALALKDAYANLGQTTGEKAIILISDGNESCGQDPCSIISTGNQKGIRTHVVGLKLDEDAQTTAKCLVQSTGGMFLEASSAAGLENALLGLLNAETSAIGTALRLSEYHYSRIPDIYIDQLKTHTKSIIKVVGSDIEIGDGVRLNMHMSRVAQNAFNGLIGDVQSISFDVDGFSVYGQHGAEILLISADGALLREKGRAIRAAGEDVRNQAKDIRKLGKSMRKSNGSNNENKQHQIVQSTGENTIMNCANHSLCQCSGSHCIMNCPDGGCTMDCSESAAMCTVNCSGGDCDVKCPTGKTCAINCPGQNCSRD